MSERPIRAVRLQLSRKPGFRLQASSRTANGLPAVKCSRPSKFGNPYRVGEPVDRAQVRRWGWTFKRFDHVCADAAEAVRRFRACLAFDEAIHASVRKELSNKNLACFCRLCERHKSAGKPLDERCPDCAPCHVDALGELVIRCEAA